MMAISGRTIRHGPDIFQQVPGVLGEADGTSCDYRICLSGNVTPAQALEGLFRRGLPVRRIDIIPGPDREPTGIVTCAVLSIIITKTGVCEGNGRSVPDLAPPGRISSSGVLATPRLRRTGEHGPRGKVEPRRRSKGLPGRFASSIPQPSGNRRFLTGAAIDGLP